jgi:FixJ family two-component response regulator
MSRKLVIVLDDDPSMLRAVQRLLYVCGVDVEIFDAPESFLESARLQDIFTSTECPESTSGGG